MEAWPDPDQGVIAPGSGDNAPVTSSRAPGRPPIPVDRIIDAALGILDDEGSDALSMRTLAGRLNSSTATLYRHFPTRSALVVSVIDRVLSEVDVEPESFRGLGWRQACEKIAGSIFEAFRRHRQAALLLADHTPTGPNAAAVRERTLAVLIDGGFETTTAARAGAMIGHLVLGFAIQLGGEQDVADPIQQVDLSRFPATAAVRRAGWRPTNIDEEFAFALQMVLDGLGRARGLA